MRKINLYCLPFAGGNKYSYRKYEQAGLPDANIISLDYPGHGDRLREPLMNSIEDIATDLHRILKNQIKGTEYVIYGHSMGGIVGFELIHQIISSGGPAPLHFFITGTVGPSSLSRKEKKWHLLSRDDFFLKLKELDGFPGGGLDDEELLDFIEPIIRADFYAVESYQYKKRLPFDFPLTVITGVEEKMKEEDIRLWQEETLYQIDFKKMEGKHFFIFDNVQDILKIITESLFKSYKTFSI